MTQTPASERREAAQRLAAALDQERQRAPMETWHAFAYRLGVSYEHLRQIRRGDVAPTEHTAALIEHALRWSRGHVDRLLQGRRGRTVPERRMVIIDQVQELTGADLREVEALFEAMKRRKGQTGPVDLDSKG